MQVKEMKPCYFCPVCRQGSLEIYEIHTTDIVNTAATVRYIVYMCTTCGSELRVHREEYFFLQKEEEQ